MAPRRCASKTGAQLTPKLKKPLETTQNIETFGKNSEVRTTAAEKGSRVARWAASTWSTLGASASSPARSATPFSPTGTNSSRRGSLARPAGPSSSTRSSTSDTGEEQVPDRGRVKQYEGRLHFLCLCLCDDFAETTLHIKKRQLCLVSN